MFPSSALEERRQADHPEIPATRQGFTTETRSLFARRCRLAASPGVSPERIPPDRPPRCAKTGASGFTLSVVFKCRARGGRGIGPPRPGHGDGLCWSSRSSCDQDLEHRRARPRRCRLGRRQPARRELARVEVSRARPRDRGPTVVALVSSGSVERLTRIAKLYWSATSGGVL